MAEEKSEVGMGAFDTARRESIEFLLGKRDSTKWHHGPREEETKPLVGALIDINKLGLLTIGSQPGMFEKHEIDCKEYTKENLAKWARQHGAHMVAAVEKEQYIEVRQRAYVEGICLLEDGGAIIPALASKGLWIHANGLAAKPAKDSVDLTTTSVITVDGWEAVVVDTHADAKDSGHIVTEFPREMQTKLVRVTIMDPLFRRNTLFDVVAAELAMLQKEKKLSAVPL